MRLALVCAAALAAASVAAAAPPRAGTLVPGRSLGGIRLGETADAVRAALGRDYGLCRGCATTTWYYTYRPFQQRGLAVELTRGRVSGIYTLWQPKGWATSGGLRLGALDGELTTAAGPLVAVVCPGYDARVADSGKARTVYYIFRGRVWGFGLVRPRANPCR
jgi:hypothetical protein